MPPDPLPLSLSDALAAAEMSRLDVASALDVATSTVWRWEADDPVYAGYAPTYQQLDALRRVLCLSPMSVVRLVTHFAARERLARERLARERAGEAS